MTPVIRPALALSDLAPSREEFVAEVLAGLRSQPKTLPPKFFYDARGSQLFDAITELPEYYPTRTETAIMEREAASMAAMLGPAVLLIEYGSGSSLKTRVLLDHLQAPVGYVPIDISCEHLMRTAEQLATDYPAIPLLPVCTDYSQPFELPEPPTPPRRRAVYFPGSTIGNLEPEVARRFLARIREVIGTNGALLIGVDLRKDPAILLPAYNDAAGVTAAFNLNLLARINREAGADFDLGQFRHEARWNDAASRIEMRLISTAAQNVQLNGDTIAFAAGEAITTEYSYKYTLATFAALAQSAGLCVERVWTDPAQLFSVQYCCYSAGNSTAPLATPP